MIEIIPAVLAKTEEGLVAAVRRLEAAGVTRVHLDICDGEFVATQTIEGFEELARLETSIKFDVHLMVKHPERFVDHWWQSGNADRFIFHIESTNMFTQLAEHGHSHGQTIFAALNPDTPLEKLDGVTGYDGVQFMTVHPGLQGQDFLPDVLPKVSRFHQAHPDTPIMVDGGITALTASQATKAGATILVSGSAILGHDNIEEAIAQIQQNV